MAESAGKSRKEQTQDISVLQLLTRLVWETDRLIKLADDIDQFAKTPQARSALNLIASEINNILQIMKASIEPLHKLYELDPGMKAALAEGQTSASAEESPQTKSDDAAYDEMSLWADVETRSE